MEPLTIIFVIIGLMAFIAIKVYFGRRFLVAIKSRQKPVSQQLD